MQVFQSVRLLIKINYVCIEMTVNELNNKSILSAFPSILSFRASLCSRQRSEKEKHTARVLRDQYNSLGPIRLELFF